MSETLLPLADSFGFTSQDLQANRQKKLSGVQYRRLLVTFLGTALGGVLLTLAPIVVTWGLIVWSTDQSLSATLGDGRAVIGYVIGLMLGVAYSLVNWHTLLLSLDLIIGRVKAVKGRATVQGSYLLIGSKYRFLLDERAQQGVQSELIYRVFILPASKTLLSIEFAE